MIENPRTEPFNTVGIKNIFYYVVNLLPPYLTETYTKKNVIRSRPPLLFSFASLLNIKASAVFKISFRVRNIFGAIPALDKAL